MRFVVRLLCGACTSTFPTVLEGERCPVGGHAHFPVEGIVQMWGASHHDPSIVVLGPARERIG